MRCSKCNRKLVGANLTCPHCEYGVVPEEVTSEQFEKDSGNENRFAAFTKHSRKKRKDYENTGFSAVVWFYRDALDFSGSIGRLEFWTQQLYLLILSMPILIVRYGLIEYINARPSFSFTIYFIFGFLLIVSIIPSISSTVRRLHDAGYSGLIYLLYYVPFIGGLILIILLLQPTKER